ncbi:hypothetical protein B484DRAFT_398850, partial [Ochromonadaceae sp. CCMP2298]
VIGSNECRPSITLGDHLFLRPVLEDIHKMGEYGLPPQLLEVVGVCTNFRLATEEATYEFPAPLLRHPSTCGFSVQELRQLMEMPGAPGMQDMFGAQGRGWLEGLQRMCVAIQSRVQILMFDRQKQWMQTALSKACRGLPMGGYRVEGVQDIYAMAVLMRILLDRMQQRGGDWMSGPSISFLGLMNSVRWHGRFDHASRYANTFVQRALESAKGSKYLMECLYPTE